MHDAQDVDARGPFLGVRHRSHLAKGPATPREVKATPGPCPGPPQAPPSACRCCPAAAALPTRARPSASETYFAPRQRDWAADSNASVLRGRAGRHYRTLRIHPSIHATLPQAQVPCIRMDGRMLCLGGPAMGAVAPAKCRCGTFHSAAKGWTFGRFQTLRPPEVQRVVAMDHMQASPTPWRGGGGQEPLLPMKLIYSRSFSLDSVRQDSNSGLWEYHRTALRPGALPIHQGGTGGPFPAPPPHVEYRG